MEKSQEKEIVKHIHSGDKQAFGLLYDAYIQDIYRFVYYKTHQKQVAEDLTSEIFTKAFEKISSFRSEKGTIKVWLYQIARNTIIDSYRTKKMTTNIEDAWDISSPENMEHDVDMKMQSKELQEYLQKLTHDQRDVIIMRLWQDMSYAEIALVMNKSEASCKMNYVRGIQELRKIMPLTLFIILLLKI